MKRSEALEIIECLPKGKTPFYYFKDRYAFLLLNTVVDRAKTKSELARSRFAKLLTKPIVKDTIAQYGRGTVTPDVLCAYWPLDAECYFLTLDIWGSNNRWNDQTTRRGHNLVLQLNFSNKHDAEYRRLIEPSGKHPFEYRGHPISRGRRRTLAWARLDIDLASGEALVEEVQTDWVRYALRARRIAARRGQVRYGDGATISKDRITQYVDSVLMPHVRLWDEAILAATIWFLREELGINTIYYHTHESGALLKKISYTLPPRSLYTKLPRKFCFSQSGERPDFLPKKAKTADSRKLLEKAKFHVMTW